ncbi:MAG TPA: methyltransferase domain-containing protein [Verrucomicrobiae bacterium]
MKKLNFGCGHRFAGGWVNIDFHSEHPEVQRVNLLRRWPFPDGCFDAVYSSHTLEHFTLATAETLLKECFRVMKPGAVIRTVVPDLENTCREYLRILGEAEGSELARRQYEWIIIELLDQLVRTAPSGLMSPFCAALEASGDRRMIEYVRSRTDTNPWVAAGGSRGDRWRKLRPAKILNKLIYIYVGLLKKMFPPSLREAVVDNTRIGEKHKWMYDRHNLGLLMKSCGFAEIQFPGAHSSRIPGFKDDFLDTNRDGSVYKPTSLFCEATKL